MTQAATTATQPHELKWVLDGRRAAVLEPWLRSRLRPDPVHPRAVVVSVYYDTPGWRFLNEKLNSDYLKSKLRLRWYEDEEGLALGEAAFLEVKTKTGSRRDKLRLPAPWPASLLSRLSRAPRSLADGRFGTVPDLARRAGADLPAALRPAFALRYERLRYIDAASGSRVSLDREIGLRAVHRRLPGPRRPRLSLAVLEVKGHGRALPASLGRLPIFGARLAAFSKYAACHALLTGETP